LVVAIEQSRHTQAPSKNRPPTPIAFATRKQSTFPANGREGGARWTALQNNKPESISYAIALRQEVGLNPTSPSPDSVAQDRGAIRRLMLFFAIVYVVEGLGQTGGLIAQPLSYFLKQVHGWTPVQVAAFLTLFNLPWVIKPLYGVISDFVPLLGYRRKSYLLGANAMAAGAFLWAAQATQPSQLAFAILLTAYGMAISSTLCGALLVENGQRYGASGRFVNQQWLWFNIATTAASALACISHTTEHSSAFGSLVKASSSSWSNSGRFPGFLATPRGAAVSRRGFVNMKRRFLGRQAAWWISDACALQNSR
jgi:hypothetical protein